MLTALYSFVRIHVMISLKEREVKYMRLVKIEIVSEYCMMTSANCI